MMRIGSNQNFFLTFKNFQNSIKNDINDSKIDLVEKIGSEDIRIKEKVSK